MLKHKLQRKDRWKSREKIIGKENRRGTKKNRKREKVDIRLHARTAEANQTVKEWSVELLIDKTCL